jgi:signal transduction histidine kinase
MENEPSLLDQCLKALLEKDRLANLGGFIQGFIHNVNGPLQNMSMLVELLQRGQEKQEELILSAGLGSTDQIVPQLAKQRQRIEQLGSQVESLAEMLRVFMVLRQIERSSTQIDVNLVLTKLSNAFKADLFFKHQVTLDLRLSRNLPFIQIPGHHIVPALVHLFRNAVTALKSSRGRHLTVESREAGGSVLIEISDNGCGVGQASRKTILICSPPGGHQELTMTGKRKIT